jgi:hypothetical protein
VGYEVSILEQLGISMRLNELSESLIPVHIRVGFMVLQVPASGQKFWITIQQVDQYIFNLE